MLVGLPVAACSYLLFMRGANLAAEREAESHDVDRLGRPHAEESARNVDTLGGV